MSPSESRATLIAAPGIPGVEVTVYDGKLQVVPPDDASEEFRWSVPRGIYKVCYQAGSAVEEHVVMVDSADVVVRAPKSMLEFTSSAPLAGTTSTHEYHTAPAVGVSRQAPRVLGEGAALFAMVRSRGGAFVRTNPAEGLVLERDGRVICEFSQIERDAANTWAAVHVALDPGAYVLRYETKQTTTSQSLFVAQGWQTQLFISEAVESAPSALDISGLAVLMARPSEGFDPDGFGLHAAELARKALRRGQSAISPQQIRMLFSDKFNNPMLGILGAHLMLLRSRAQRDLLTNVLTHLDRLAPGHPDAACLHLALDPNAPVEISAAPMLGRSWDLLVEASTRRERPLELSALNHVAGRLWETGGPWLTWGDMKRGGDATLPRFQLGLRRQQGMMGIGFIRERESQSRARILLRAIANPEGLTRSDVAILADPRNKYWDLGAGLADKFDLSESEVGFVDLANAAYVAEGRRGLRAEVLAPRLRMPAPLVRHAAYVLASKLNPPPVPRTPQTTPQARLGGGIARGTSS